MNEARQHTDQADTRETFASVEQKLRAAGYQEPAARPPLSGAEARARALQAANISRSRCTDCPCDGMGAVAAGILLLVGAVIGSALTLLTMRFLW
jgi:hypothetical protein